MADEFDRFLSAALTPPDRMPDRSFAARVQAAILLDEQLAAQRRSLVSSLAKQLLALFAVAAGVWLAGRASPIASLFAESPALGLAILLTAFMCLVGILSVRSGNEAAPLSLI